MIGSLEPINLFKPLQTNDTSVRYKNYRMLILVNKKKEGFFFFFTLKVSFNIEIYKGGIDTDRQYKGMTPVKVAGENNKFSQRHKNHTHKP